LALYIYIAILNDLSDNRQHPYIISPVLEELTEFIQSNPDPRELKRAITVSMWLKGYKQREIQESLSVSSGFISKWTQIFTMQGVSALKLA
jgi:putative transposase